MWSLFSDRNDPFRLLDSFERHLAGAYVPRGRLADPSLTFSDRGEELVLQADVPGVRHEDVEIMIQGDFLNLRAERAPVAVEGFELTASERQRTQLLRQIELPCKIDAENVRAHLEDGVLTLQLPKATEAKPRRITVKASSN